MAKETKNIVIRQNKHKGCMQQKPLVNVLDNLLYFIILYI